MRIAVVVLILSGCASEADRAAALLLAREECNWSRPDDKPSACDKESDAFFVGARSYWGRECARNVAWKVRFAKRETTKALLAAKCAAGTVAELHLAQAKIADEAARQKALFDASPSTAESPDLY
jgi:hypothetical protein